MAADKKNATQDKKVALENALKQLEKQYGPGTVMRLGENPHLNVDAISTGSLTLDIATGIGGCLAAGLLRYMALNLQVKQRLRCTALQSARKKAE